MLSSLLIYLMENLRVLVLSEYAENLSGDARKRYKLKLCEIFCEVDPYIDNQFKNSVERYDFLVNSIHSSNSNQNAFKSLDP